MKVFLTIARTLYDKGYSELIEASRILRRERQNCRFKWLGPIDEQYPQHVTKATILQDQKSGLIEYLGVTADVRKSIRRSDCIVLPSYHEGMSRVLMESLAMGKPIITTDIAGCREMVIEGENGFLCKPGDAKSLVEAIKKFIRLDLQEVKEMGKKSRELAESRFNVMNVIKVYEDIIKECKK